MNENLDILIDRQKHKSLPDRQIARNVQRKKQRRERAAEEGNDT